MNKKYLPLLVILQACFILRIQAGQYFQDFSAASVGTTTNFGDGSALFSDQLGTVAQVVDGTYKELALTASDTLHTASAFLLPDLDAGTPVFAFSAKWNAEVYGDFPNAADGFSFNFGQLDSLNLLAGALESGYTNGLSFCAQTYAGNNPGFYLRLNGNIIASQTNDPAVQWGNFSTKRHFFEVDWNYTNGVTVRVDGQAIFTNVATPALTIQSGNRFAWAARCGGVAEEVRLDNLIVVTGGNLTPVPMTAPYYYSEELVSAGQTADKVFDGLIATKWLAEANTGYVGATCSNNTQAVLAYAITSAEDVPGRDPAVWTVKGSSDGGANLTTCGNGGGFFTNRNETRGWLATNQTPFTTYLLNISQNNGDAYLQMAEMQLWGFAPLSGQPLVLSQSVTNSNPEASTFYASVNPLTLSANVWFEWGLTSNYDNTTVTQNFADGQTNVTFSQTVTNLSAGTTYHYHAVVQTATGTTQGPDQTFQTQTFELLSLPPELIGDSRDSAVWGDYDNDGYLDLLFTRRLNTTDVDLGDLSTNRVQLWHNNGDGTFTRVPLPTLPNSFLQTDTFQPEFLDINNDGKLDIILKGFAGSGGLQYFLNMGASGFVLTNVPGFTTKNAIVVWADYDNDGKPDFFTASAVGTAYQLWHNDGGGQFHQAPFPAAVNPWLDKTIMATWVDDDGDGNLDLMIMGQTNYESSPQQTALEFYRNLGNGQFQLATPQQYKAIDTSFMAAINWSDLDNDGHLDMLLTGTYEDWNQYPYYYYEDTASSLFWTGAWTILDRTVPALNGNGSAYVGFNHYNRDEPINGPAYYSIACGDYNHDGRQDIVLAGIAGQEQKSPLTLYRNDGLKYAFGQTNLVVTDVAALEFGGVPSVSFGSVMWGDFDNNGTLDLLIQPGTPYGNPTGTNTIYFAQAPQIWVNKSAYSNSPPTSPTGLNLLLGGGHSVVLSWSRATDLETPTLGLSYNLRVGTTPGGSDVFNPMAGPDGHRRIPALGNVREQTFAIVNGLTPGQTYYWSVQAVDGALAGGPFAPEQSFVAQASPPIVITGSPTAVGVRHATVQARVNSAAQAALTWVELGVSTNYGSASATQATSLDITTNTYNYSFVGLVPATTYHYRAVASNTVGTVYGGDQTFTTLPALSLLNVVTADDPVVGSSTNSPAGQPVNYATDGDANTKYANSDKLNTGLTIYPTGTNVVRALTLISADNAPESDPASFQIEGSLDLTNFTLIVSNTVPPFPARHSIQSFSFPNNTAYIAYRVTFPTVQDATAASAMQIAEVQLLAYGAITTTHETLSFMVPTNTEVDYRAALFDGQLLDYTNRIFISNTNNGFDDVYAVINLSPEIGSSILKGIQLIGGNQGLRATSVRISGANGGTNYTALLSVEPNYIVAPFQVQNFPLLDNSVAYESYQIRLEIGPGDSVNVGELRLLGLAAPVLSFMSIVTPRDPVVGSSTNSPAGQTVPYATDGTADTKYLNLDKLNAGFTVIPAINNLTVRALGLISAEDAPERDPASFILRGSENGINFTTIASNTVPPFASRHSIQSFTFANTNNYVAYQVLFPTVQNPAAANSMQIGEVELFPYGEITSPGDDVNLTALPSGAFFTTDSALGSLFDRMLDQPTNKLVEVNDSGNTSIIVTPAAGASVLKGFEIIGGYDDTNFPERAPSSVMIEGLLDGVNYTGMMLVNPVTPTANMQIQGFQLLGNTYASQSYRITLGPPKSGSVLQLGEIRLFGQIVVQPVAQPMTVYRTAGLTLKIALADVATNWSDANGETVSLAGINPVTTNGVNLTTNSSYIFYTNAPNVNDQISYSITNSGGATNVGLINIVIVASVTGQATGEITVSGNSTTIGFAGRPDYTYSVQRSTNLVDWVTLWTTNAPANGLFNYTDTFGDLGVPPAPAPSSAYYRLSWSP